MQNIRIIPENELEIILPLLKILNNSIPDEVLRERLEHMRQHSYKCTGYFINDKLVAICGFWILVKYYVGKHIEPDNVLVLPEYRGREIGHEMMKFIYQVGLDNGCIASELNCYVNNNAGVKFWINQGYKIIGYHFQKHLSNDKS